MDVFTVANCIVFLGFVVIMALAGLALRLLRPPCVAEESPVEEVVTSAPRTCSLCGDDLDAPVVDAARFHQAEDIAAILNGMAGVRAQVHVQRSGHLCVRVAFKQYGTSQRDYAHVMMLGWQMANPKETISLRGTDGKPLVIGPQQEVR